MTNDPKILLLALLGGIIPALLWLWFWLKEDSQRPEPKGVIATIFLIGMLSVVITIPVQKFIQSNVLSYQHQIILWASAEELIKYLGVTFMFYRTNHADEPVDWPIFLITVALGFAALENAMFLIKPLSAGQTTVSLLTGGLRFLGSTLLHAVSSGVVGIALGLSFHLGKFAKKIYLLAGLLLAVVLHSTFNFFIMEGNGGSFLRVSGFLWVITIIIMLLFEKLRRMSA